MLNEKVPEKFVFLFVGQWNKGGYGEDRKDISKMIKVFYESFDNKKKQTALLLKKNRRNSAYGGVFFVQTCITWPKIAFLVTFSKICE